MTGPALFKLSVTSQSAGQTSETLSGLGEGACLRTGSEEVNLFILYHGIILELTSDKGATAGPALKAALIQAARVAIAKFLVSLPQIDCTGISVRSSTRPTSFC